MNECDLCFSETRNRRRDLPWNDCTPMLFCNRCRQHNDDYRSMTPEDWALEERMIATHCADRRDYE